MVPSAGLLEPRTRKVAWLGRRVPNRTVASARARAARIGTRLTAMFADIDVLVTPTLTRPAARIGGWMHKGLVGTASGAGSWVPYCMTWNVVGFPALSFPAGLSRAGLPLAVQLVAPPGREALLLRVAAALEHTRGPFPRPPL
jgi:amidase